MPWVGIALALLVCGAWLFSGALFGGKVLAGDDLLLFNSPMNEVRPATVVRPSNQLNYDSAHVFHPDLMAARRAIRSGALPAWTSEIAAGRPLLAAQQSAPLFPTNWPAYVLPFWSSLEVTALLKVLLAGLGMALFCMSLGLRRAPALLGGVAFAFSTYFIGWLAHPHTNVYLLLPWIMLAVRRVVSGPSALNVAGLGVSVGLVVLGGHANSVLLIALLAVPFAVYELLVTSTRRRVAAGTGLVLGGLVGLALGAVMLLPMLEALAQSIDNDLRGGTALLPQVGNTFFFPEMWGRPDTVEFPGGPHNFQERTGYFGVAPLLLALAGLTVRPTRPQAFFAAMLVVCIGIVFVQPVAEALDALPGYTNVNLWRSIILIVFCGSVLAAFGLQRLIEADRRQAIRLAVIVTALAGAVGGQWLVRHAGTLSALREVLGHLPVIDKVSESTASGHQLGSVLRWLAVGLATAGLVAVASLRPRLAPAAVWLVVAVAAFDLVAVGRGYHPAVPEEAVDPGVPPAVAALRAAERDGSRSVGEGLTYPANLSHRFQTRDAREHELPAVERYHRVWLALRGTGVGNTLQRKHFWLGEATDRLLDAFAVRWVYAPTLASSPREGYRPLRSHPMVFENVDAFPRAWTAYSWRGANGFERALAEVSASSAQTLLRRPVIEGAPRTGAESSDLRTDPAVVRSERPDEVVVEATARRPGFLVLADTFYPGWKAEIDGRGVAIAAANGAFRAVPLPAGRHEVRFTYASAAVRWGWIISLVGLALVSGILARALMRRLAKRGTSPSPLSQAS